MAFCCCDAQCHCPSFSMLFHRDLQRKLVHLHHSGLGDFSITFFNFLRFAPAFLVVENRGLRRTDKNLQQWGDGAVAHCRCCVTKKRSSFHCNSIWASLSQTLASLQFIFIFITKCYQWWSWAFGTTTSSSWFPRAALILWKGSSAACECHFTFFLRLCWE